MNAAKNTGTLKVETYLFFDGRCEEAIEFYRQTLGAKDITLMRYQESPEPPPPGMVPPNYGNKIMYASFRIGDTHLMASDGCNQNQASFQGFSLSVAAPNEAEAKKVFHALAEGGQVRMPLAKTFFAPCFGMVADRFGMGWMVIVEH